MNVVDQCRASVFKELWSHYYKLVPFAAKIESSFKARGDKWVEDHVAYRTLPGDNTGRHILQEAFELLGYKREDDYHFEEKRLDAFWMSPSDVEGDSESASAKIFISELILDSFSDEFKAAMTSVTSQVKNSPIPRLKDLQAKAKAGDETAQAEFVKDMAALLTKGPDWSTPEKGIYETFKKESDYAAWTYLFGHQINHFTVSVHLMTSFTDIAEMGGFIEKDLDIPMNQSGGLVKGTEALKLEQIATMAAKVPYKFKEGEEPISYGFVEFAKRYPLEGQKDDGTWKSYYQGFVAANADKIFESTYK